MASSNSFKDYQRGARTQLPEENYGAGMYWTNAPLTEGFSHTLVNYDYKDQGASLIPRMGLRAFEVAVFPLAYTTTGNPPEYTATMHIVDGKHCAEADKIYGQLILADNNETDNDSDTGLLHGKGYLYTVLPEGDTLEVQHPPALAEIPFREIHSEPLHSADGHLFFKKPNKAEIHKVPISNTQYFPRHIGTFGFGNRYFCFRREMQDDALVPELIQSVFKEEGYYGVEVINPKELTPKEAVMWGYNMLSTTPYNFSNTNAAGTIQLLGTLPYDASGQLIMSPVVNQTVHLECFYAAPSPSTHRFVWEWKEPGASGWLKLKEATLDTGAKTKATCVFSAPTTSAMIRVSAYQGTATDPDQVLTIGLNFNKGSYGSTANITPKNYSLHTCIGMTYWHNQLVVYGPKEDRTMLFVSEVNDPGYFPFPAKADHFDEPIIHAMPLLDNLLVFTTTALHILTLNADGLSWGKQTLQKNLDIKEWDLHLIRTVKNMVFFKSGNFYYMVVPSSKGDGSLTIAPITKYMEGFFNEFLIGVEQTVVQTYTNPEDLQLVHYYNFLDFEDMHNVYVFQTESGRFINLAALYNIVNRSWRLYLFESEHIVLPYMQDATTRGVYMTLTPVVQRYLSDGEQVTRTVPGVQFLKYNALENADFYIPQNFKYQPALGETPDASDDPYALHAAVKTYNNYQVMDTGYREQNSDKRKRYREIQFKLNNTSQRTLRFQSEFYIDGELRRGMYRYIVQHNIDPDSPDYGLIYIERVLLDPSIVPEVLPPVAPGATILGGGMEDDGTWELDMSLFPEVTFWKVRIPVSGKGYTPRFVLVSKNEMAYELLNHSWIFRQMYSR